MNEPDTPDGIDEPVTDLLLLLEDVLLRIDELQRLGEDPAEIEDLRAYAASLRSQL